LLAAGLALGASFAFTGEGRDLRPRRCALPITALRETPPSSSAIWLAVAPPSHILVSVAIRSSVQLIESSIPQQIGCLRGRRNLPDRTAADSRRPMADQAPTTPARKSVSGGQAAGRAGPRFVPYGTPVIGSFNRVGLWTLYMKEVRR